MFFVDAKCISSLEISYKEICRELNLDFNTIEKDKVKDEVGKKLMNYSEWFILFDDAKDYNEIEKYIPTLYNGTQGNVIITSIKSNIIINKGNIINLSDGMFQTDSIKFIKSVVNNDFIKNINKKSLERLIDKFAKKFDRFPLQILPAILHFNNINHKKKMANKKLLTLNDYLMKVKDNISPKTRNKHKTLANENSIGIIQIERINYIYKDLEKKTQRVLFFCSLLNKNFIPKALILNFIHYVLGYKFSQNFEKAVRDTYKDILIDSCSLLIPETNYAGHIGSDFLRVHSVTQGEILAQNKLNITYHINSDKEIIENYPNIIVSDLKEIIRIINGYSKKCSYDNAYYLIAHYNAFISNLSLINLENSSLAKELRISFSNFLFRMGYLKNSKEVLLKITGVSKDEFYIQKCIIDCSIDIILGNINNIENQLLEILNLVKNELNNNQYKRNNLLFDIYIQLAVFYRRSNNIEKSLYYVNKAYDKVEGSKLRLEKYYYEIAKTQSYRIATLDDGIKNIKNIADYEKIITQSDFELTTFQLDSLTLLADLYISKLEPQKGIPLIELILSKINLLKERNLRITSQIAKLHTLRGFAYLSIKDFEKAKYAYIDAYEIAEKEIGDKDRILPEVLLNLTFCCVKSNGSNNLKQKLCSIKDHLEKVVMVYKERVSEFNHFITHLILNFDSYSPIDIAKNISNLFYTAYLNFIGPEHPYTKIAYSAKEYDINSDLNRLSHEPRISISDEFFKKINKSDTSADDLDGLEQKSAKINNDTYKSKTIEDEVDEDRDYVDSGYGCDIADEQGNKAHLKQTADKVSPAYFQQKQLKERYQIDKILNPVPAGSIYLTEDNYQNPSKGSKLRTGIKNQENLMKLLASHLSKGMILGEAYNQGDCFFDALAQILNRINNTNFNSAKYLRKRCHDFYMENMNNKALVDQWNSSEYGKLDSKDDYYFVQYTAEECEQLFNGRVPIWGRPYVEGKILCRQLQLEAICVIEVLEDPDTKKPVLSFYLADQNNYKSLTEEAAGQWLRNPKIPIIVVEQNSFHFVPVIDKSAAVQMQPVFGVHYFQNKKSDIDQAQINNNSNTQSDHSPSRK